VAAADNITAVVFLVGNAVADGPDIQEEVMYPRRAPSPLSIETLSWTQHQNFAAYLPGSFAVQSSHCKPDYVVRIVTESWASLSVDDGDVIDVLAGCRPGSCGCGQHNCRRGQCRRGRP
jgi:hypothetical protein